MPRRLRPVTIFSIAFFVLVICVVPSKPLQEHHEQRAVFEEVRGNENPIVLQESTSSAARSPSADHNVLPTHRVVRSVDGDTIVVSYHGKNETVRLIGIDTPESVHPRQPVECFGKEASAFTASLTAGKDVSLVFDASQGERDKYGRLLAYVILPDGRNLNALLVQEGYAHEYTHGGVPYQYQDEFRLAQRQAREAKRGLWAANACASSALVE